MAPRSSYSVRDPAFLQRTKEHVILKQLGKFAKLHPASLSKSNDALIERLEQDNEQKDKKIAELKKKLAERDRKYEKSLLEAASGRKEWTLQMNIARQENESLRQEIEELKAETEEHRATASNARAALEGDRSIRLEQEFRTANAQLQLDLAIDEKRALQAVAQGMERQLEKVSNSLHRSEQLNVMGREHMRKGDSAIEHLTVQNRKYREKIDELEIENANWLREVNVLKKNFELYQARVSKFAKGASQKTDAYNLRPVRKPASHRSSANQPSVFDDTKPRGRQKLKSLNEAATRYDLQGNPLRSDVVERSVEERPELWPPHIRKQMQNKTKVKFPYHCGPR